MNFTHCRAQTRTGGLATVGLARQQRPTVSRTRLFDEPVHSVVSRGGVCRCHPLELLAHFGLLPVHLHVCVCVHPWVNLQLAGRPAVRAATPRAHSMAPVTYSSLTDESLNSVPHKEVAWLGQVRLSLETPSIVNYRFA